MYLLIHLIAKICENATKEEKSKTEKPNIIDAPIRTYFLLDLKILSKKREVRRRTRELKKYNSLSSNL